MPLPPSKRSSSVSKRAKKRRSPKRVAKPVKKKSAKKARVSKRSVVAKKGRSPKRAAKPAKKARAKKARPSKRSIAASKGWETRRKKKRLLEAMTDLRMRRTAESQPLGWLERRAEVRRLDDDGTFWRQIITTYDQDLVDAKRLETLAELEIDMLNRFDLHDYLEWVGDETDVDTSDMYRMYLGYPLEGSLSV